MILYFLRHANAGQRWANPVRDRKRPLDPEGMEQCRAMGKLLAALDIHVDHILTSPLKRATQTASMVANELAFEQRIEKSEVLAPGADFKSFVEMLYGYDQAESIMVVGHNPNMSRFVSLLITGGSSEKALEMKKGSVARVEMTFKRSVLHWLVSPRLTIAALEAASGEYRQSTASVIEMKKAAKEITKKAAGEKMPDKIYPSVQTSSRPKSSKK